MSSLSAVHPYHSVNSPPPSAAAVSRDFTASHVSTPQLHYVPPAEPQALPGNALFNLHFYHAKQLR